MFSYVFRLHDSENNFILLFFLRFKFFEKGVSVLASKNSFLRSFLFKLILEQSQSELKKIYDIHYPMNYA